MTSFFGGDPNVAHFTASPYFLKPGEKVATKNPRRREEYDKLRALGWKAQYFQFRVKDEAGKAAAKAACEAHAAKWKAKAGVDMEVCEGFCL